jgi:hypothetical protein
MQAHVLPLVSVVQVRFARWRGAVVGDRLSLFSVIWSVTCLVHVFSFYHYWKLLFGSAFYVYPIVLAALAVLLWPRVTGLLMVLLFCTVVKSIAYLPLQANHIVFELIVSGGMLLALLAVAVEGRISLKALFSDGEAAQRERLLEAFSPAIRAALLILYGYAVLHKLNYDFFNPEISCSTFLLDGIQDRLPWVPNGGWVRTTGAVWGTLLIEALIPLLLAFGRTRAVGIVLGLAFHYFLALHPHRGLYSFSSLMYALYFLFLPAGFLRSLVRTAGRLSLRRWGQVPVAWRALLLSFPLAAGGVVAIAMQLYPQLDTDRWFRLGFLGWHVWALAFSYFYLAVLTNPLREDQHPAVAGYGNRWAWLVPLAVLLNGTTPYLGLKTQISFSMFSNLRTEGGMTNHLFIPVTLRLTQMQEDLVDIIDSDASEFRQYAQREQLITLFEFRRIASRLKHHKDFTVHFRHQGATRNLVVRSGVENLPVYTESHPWWMAKVVRFRPVDKGPCRCKH